MRKMENEMILTQMMQMGYLRQNPASRFSGSPDFFEGQGTRSAEPEAYM